MPHKTLHYQMPMYGLSILCNTQSTVKIFIYKRPSHVHVKQLIDAQTDFLGCRNSALMNTKCYIIHVKGCL